MNEGPVNQGAMVETTDSLEAVGVFRRWKNIFFVIVLICLLLAQAAFWLIDLKIVKTGEAATVAAAPAPPVAPATPPTDVNAVEKAAGQAVAGEPETAAPAAESPGFFGSLSERLNVAYLTRAIQIINGILIVAVVLYTMALFFCLLISLVGRLGGIRHVSRAYFLAVIMLILVVPWQALFQSPVPGVTYTVPELLHWMTIKSEGLASLILYYLRFSGYWLLFFVLLLMSEVRSVRWTKSILRRLEII
jgi:hypothetical protein